MKKITKLILFALLFQVSLAEVSYTANPSTTTVMVTIPALVQVSSLSDITLSPIDFSSSITGNTSVCIYTNTITPLGSYYVTASSAHASSGTFRVANGSQFITYNAYWNTASSPAQNVSLVSSVKTSQQTGGNGVSLTCAGSPNANFNIQFSNAQIAGAPAGTYTDTVTLLISPS